MKVYAISVTSDRPYPITTEGTVAATGWPAAAQRAVRKHLADLKDKGRNRKRCSEIVIKLRQLRTEKPAD